jgi:hypothetical protein
MEVMPYFIKLGSAGGDFSKVATGIASISADR